MMTPEPLLMTRGSWVLRLRPASGDPARLLLLLHGWTGDENSMWVFARNFSENIGILAPRAPYPAPEGGYSWRTITPNSWGFPSLDELRPAADALVQLVDELAHEKAWDAAQFDVIGFSQGAALTCLLGLLHPQRVRCMGVLAGFLPAGAETLLAARLLTGKPIYMAHGTQDELVPIQRARETVAALEQAGAQVSYCEVETGHKVSAECLRGMEAFFV
jgi:phospholipase/carboxylesterase